MREMAAQIKNSDDMLIRHLAHMTADAMDVAIAAVFSARTGLPISTSSAVPIGPSHQTIAHPSQSMWHTLCGAWSTCFPISEPARTCWRAVCCTTGVYLRDRSLTAVRDTQDSCHTKFTRWPLETRGTSQEPLLLQSS